MQVENFSKYQSWVEAEMECAKGVRKRKQKVFWKCMAIAVIIAVVVGFIGFLLDASSDTEAGVIALAVVMFVVPLITLILFFSMLPGFLKGRYAKKINRAIRQQGFSDAQREQFAQEQLAAQRNSATLSPYLPGSSRASQETAIPGFHKQALLGIHKRVWILCLYMGWISSCGSL